MQSFSNRVALITSCIVNISSHAGVRPKGASIPYSVSKAALNHLTRLLAVTLAPAIRVNAMSKNPLYFFSLCVLCVSVVSLGTSKK
ncbi:SDR family NAD(P)-dependent oxidoreductase [Nostoc sp.]|uniref:SDR family NAD(P)-dependent oxidoreductase n=1 Tax=Nostoc sp. TaxID=1180 RepID=UPI002FF5E504